MSERLQSLFQAARDDAPSPEARVAMWVGIETASLSVGAGAVGAGAGTGVVAAKTAVATTKLVIGLILGASLTAGVTGAIVVGVLSRDSQEHVEARPAPRALERASTPLPQSSVDPGTLITGHVVPATKDEVIELPVTTANPERTGTATLSEHDRLAREARMVNEARGALHRGEPDAALRIVRAARSQPGARLVPEELTVEAQALRATGDEAGAQRVDAELARRFPDGQLPGH